MKIIIIIIGIIRSGIIIIIIIIGILSYYTWNLASLSQAQNLKPGPTCCKWREGDAMCLSS